MEKFLRSLPEREAALLLYNWEQWWARPKQLAPTGDWRNWFVQAGRGFGKTRCGAEWVRGKVERGEAGMIALVSDTAADVRDVMIEGPKQGLLAVCPPWNKPKYEPSKRRVTWPNGAMAIAYAAEAPELLRGPEHDAAWCDELAKWKNLRKQDAEGGTAWDNVQMGLRVGLRPQCCVTTTPRNVPAVKDIIRDPRTVVTRGSTWENVRNIAADTLAYLLRKYGGRRLGRQELEAELLEDVEGALWTMGLLDALRVTKAPADLFRVVVAVDPAVSTGPSSNETGIVVVGLGPAPDPANYVSVVATRPLPILGVKHGYVLADLSGQYTPGQWGEVVLNAVETYGADCVVGEVNNGGNLVEHNVRVTAQMLGRRQPRFKAVHASRGKLVRAEPIAGLDEQGAIHHVGAFPEMEDQLTTYVADSGEDSPDRLDARVWGFTELFPNEIVGVGGGGRSDSKTDSYRRTAYSSERRGLFGRR